MTRVILYHDKGGVPCGFECRGHAGFAEEGHDIVCAAVSVLASTCVNALESVAGQTPELETGDGLVKAHLDQPNHDAVVLLKAFEQGIQDIGQSYSKYIRITVR